MRWRPAAIKLLLAVLIAMPAAAPAGQLVALRPEALVALRREQRQRERILAGHLLRRLGFGPNRKEMHEVLRLGRAAYSELQLHPERIDDRTGERLFFSEPGQFRWLTRMAFSRRQLQEKMTLLWHGHFATSIAKVKTFALMRDQEQLFRDHALGNFRDLLIAVTRDNAMLIFLDNDHNDGQATDDDGDRVPPNENYARELLQLFALGPHRLDLDGTVVLDTQGNPVPSYSEDDVKEVARALTGWYVVLPDDTMPQDPDQIVPPARFQPTSHDPGEKRIMGRVIAADAVTGWADVERVVDIIMHQPSTAPFIAKELILQLATETPSPGFVERVATVFARSDGDIRATVGAILSDAEFYSPAVVRTQYKTPVEHVVGALRGLGASSRGATLQYWTMTLGQALYEPPSVFSFYRPGEKRDLVTAGYVAFRDQATDMIANDYRDLYFDTRWDAAGLIRRRRLQRQPARAVDILADDILAAPVPAAMRQALIEYIGEQVTEEKLRGAAWLIMCSQEYQVN